jgi:hypothetical protein
VKCGEDVQGESYSGLTAAGGKMENVQRRYAALRQVSVASSGIRRRKLHTDASLLFCFLQKGGKQALGSETVDELVASCFY